MRSLVLLAVLLLAAPAHAMGGYVEFQLVAWNPDGTAVLIRSTATSSGTVGMTQQYILVGARDAEPLVVTFDDTQDGDTRRQKIDRAACVKNGQILRKALIAHRFRGLVTASGDRCKTDRSLLSFKPGADQLVDSSLVPDLTNRPPTTLRELRVKAALDLLALPDVPDEVTSPNGDLVLVLFGRNGDESGPANAAVIATTPTGPKVIVGGLR